MIEIKKTYYRKNKEGKRERYITKEKIYTVEECKEKGIPYKYWKDLTEDDIGKVLGLSDDGYCGRVVNIFPCRSQKRGTFSRFIKLSYGVGFAGDYPTKQILFEKNHSLRCYSGVTPKSWLEMELKKSRLKRFAYILALMKVSGKVDWVKAGRSYRPDSKYPGMSAQKLYSKRRVKQMVEEEIKKLLNLQGITEEWVVVKTKRAMEIAEKKNEVGGMMKVIDKTAKWLGMDGQKETESIELERKEYLEDKIMEEKKLKLKRSSNFLNKYEEEDGFSNISQGDTRFEGDGGRVRSSALSEEDKGMDKRNEQGL